MRGMPLKWKLNEVLDKHDITPYRLIQESGVAPSTIYRITGGKTEAVQGRVLDDILSALYRLTSKRFEIGDILEWQPSRGLRNG
jgi:DNA-binding Xre family transcriptional regulator